MKNKEYWKNNGTKKNPIYDFTYPESWGENEIIKENINNINKIKSENAKYKYEWMEQLKHIPKNLMGVLLYEMERGNAIRSISNSNWPNNGSIVVIFRDKFHEKNKKIKGTQWREVNDPHYGKEEIAEISNEIEHLLIN